VNFGVRQRLQLPHTPMLATPSTRRMVHVAMQMIAMIAVV
jgi:hypothetical protein